MAEIPFYLQGTQTANAMYPGSNAIQSGANQGLLSNVGSQGAVQGAVSSAAPTAMTSAEIQALYNSGATPNQISQAISDRHKQISSYASGTSAAASGAIGAATPNTGVTTIGQSGGWMSPEQMRAGTNALSSTGNTSQSGGGGGSGGTAPDLAASASGTSGGGSGGLGLGNGMPQSGSSPSFNSAPTQYPTAQPFSYQNPQNAPLPAQGGALNMQQADPQAAMNTYLQSPGNQLLGDPSYTRYEQSPGYQYAVDEAMRQVQRGGASRGLLESGSVMRDMTDRAQGMAQQDYGNWWNRQNQLFGDYQNRLAGLAGGATGSTEANQLGQNLGAGSALIVAVHFAVRLQLVGYIVWNVAAPVFKHFVTAY